MGARQFRADGLCDSEHCEPCAIKRNIVRYAGVPPTRQTARDAWSRYERGRIGSTVEAAVGWLRGVLRDAARAVVYMVEEHPYASGALALFLIGGAYIVAPETTGALLKQAAGVLGREIGAQIHAEFWSYV